MKKIWLVFQVLLFTILTGSYFAGDENLFGITLTIFILESFPLNLLIGWVFFAYAGISNYPALLFLFALVMSGLSYFQWFDLVPRIVDYLKKPFAKHDREVNLIIEKREPLLIAEPIEEWATNVASSDQRSPVDRFLS